MHNIQEKFSDLSCDNVLYISSCGCNATFRIGELEITVNIFDAKKIIELLDRIIKL